MITTICHKPPTLGNVYKSPSVCRIVCAPSHLRIYVFISFLHRTHTHTIRVLQDGDRGSPFEGQVLSSAPPCIQCAFPSPSLCPSPSASLLSPAHGQHRRLSLTRGSPVPLSRSAYPSTPLLKAKEKVDVSCMHVQYIVWGKDRGLLCVGWKCRTLCCVVWA